MEIADKESSIQAGTGQAKKLDNKSIIPKNRLADDLKIVLSGMLNDKQKRENIFDSGVTEDCFSEHKEKAVFRYLSRNKNFKIEDLLEKIETDFDWYKSSKELKECGGLENIERIRVDYDVQQKYLFDQSLERVIKAYNAKRIFHIATQIIDNYKRGNIAKVEQLNDDLSKFTVNQNSSSEDIPGIKEPGTLADDAYHGLAGEFIRKIEPHTESDPAALLMGFLTAFGNIIGPKAHFKIEATKHTAKLFLVFVGGTSKGRKGTAQDWIDEIFKYVEPEWNEKDNVYGLVSGEGIIYHVRDPILKKDEVIDPGVEDKRLLIVETEFAQALKVMAREGNTLSPIIRRVWESPNLRTLSKNSPITATGTHISIIAHITCEELMRSMKETEAFNGFANRIVWIYVKRSKELPFGGNLEISELESLISRLREIVAWAKDADKIIWHEDTREIWGKVYSKLSRERYGMHGLVLSRAEAQVTRLALIYALLDRSYQIKPQHLYAALAIWDYVEESTLYIFQDRTGNRHADKILEKLKESGELSRTEIYRNVFQKNLKSELIDRALSILESQDLIKIQEIKNDAQGKPKKIIKLVQNNV